MVDVLEQINAFVWGAPALLGILGVGIYLTVATRFAQLTLFPKACRSFFGKLFGRRRTEHGVSAFQALCTALAATVGTGNIAGVAGAIAVGGPGAIFWMWICAFVGMIVKFAEATLSVHFRRMDDQGNFLGGPMYMICNGMGARWNFLACIYCFLGIVAAFGVGNATQINALIGSIDGAVLAFGGTVSRNTDLLMGAGLAVLITIMLLGGAKRIGRIAEMLVPAASLGYLLLGAGVLICHADAIPTAFCDIITGAFSPKAVTGGMLGSALIAMRIGVSRGVFTNEAGMGTAGIAHAGASVEHPAEQGLMGIIEVFLDTIVICTMTALVILCSGVTIPYGTDEGVALTTRAFSNTYGPWVSVAIALFLCCFAFATVLGWGLYGMRCAQFLFGEDVWKRFVLIQAVVVMFSAILQTGTIWLLAETINGLMAIPNLIALAALSPTLIRLTKEYKKKSGRQTACGGKYESIHQRKQVRTLTYEKVSSFGSRGKKERENNLPFEHRSA